MMEYILKMKNVSNNLSAVGEPVKEIDQILQLLGGLGLKYNAIVASLTTRDEELSLHSVHSMLLTHEQRLTSHNTSSSYRQAENVMCKMYAYVRKFTRRPK